MNPDKIAKEIVEEVMLSEASKETQAANVSHTRSTTADKMPTVDGYDEDGGETSGKDAKAKRTSDTNKYKAGGMNEMEQSEMEGETAPESDENESKRDSEYAPKTGKAKDGSKLMNEMDKMDYDCDCEKGEKCKECKGMKYGKKYMKEMEDNGDEEEADDEYGEDMIKKKIEEHLASDEMSETIREHLSKMFETSDDSLNEEFTTKASTIFEAAVGERVRSTLDIIVEENTRIITEKLESLDEANAAHQDTLTEQIDSYLTMVAEEWMKENELQVETGLRTEITEEFMSGLRDLMVEHNIDVPDSGYDVINEMNDDIESLTAQLNEALENNASSNSELKKARKDRIISESCRDLTLTEIQKLKSLTENISFDNEEQYLSEVKTIKEAYLSAETVSETSEGVVELNEDVSNVNVDPTMAYLLNGMGKFGNEAE